MCGIFGLWRVDGEPLDLAIVQQAMATLRQRGPDDEGYLLAQAQTGCVALGSGPDTDAGLNLPPLQALAGQAFNLALGFRRLAILDLSPAGHQPMVSADGRSWLVFNGEIYNYLELRAELKSLGHVFRSNSDSEVLLAAYAQWGCHALNRLVGMFACAILDLQTHQLFLARDFFGIKPLYYTYWRDGFAFSSEIKALLELPGVTRRVNPQRLYHYLRYELTDHGGETFFADIYQLPAAHYLTLPLDNPGVVQPVRYWQVQLDQQLELSFDEAAAHLRTLFLESIKLHLRSDVPVGTALSGGIDSSAIVMAMRHVQGHDLKLHAFSYIAHDPKLSEERWVDMVGRASGALVEKVQPGPAELIADLEQLIHIQDEPFSSTSIYAQYRVFQLARQANIKVMLDGQGADELLAGYRPYLMARLASLLRRGQWHEAQHFLQRTATLLTTSEFAALVGAIKLLLPPQLQHLARRFIGKQPFFPWLNGPWFAGREVKTAFEWNYGPDVLRAQLHHALIELSIPSLLRYEDRNSMAFSIESRVPFLTPALVNFIFALPEAHIINANGTSKAVFRQAMTGLVPDAVLERQDKIGFSTPEQNWLVTLRPWIEDVLHSEAAARVPALNLKGVEAEWQAVLTGQAHFDFRVWRWLNVIRWADQYAVSFE